MIVLHQDDSLICFQAITGLKVNVGKSKIVPIRKMSNLDD